MRKGMGLVTIIIVIVVLVILFSVIGTMVIPALQKIPETGERALVQAKILPESYYIVDRLVGERGMLTFYVLDPLNTAESSDDVYVTDFHTITGYQVFEDRVPTIVESVSAAQNLYITIVADPQIEISEPFDLISHARNLNLNRFNNTFVNVVSVTAPDIIPEYSHKDIAGCVTCETGAADLWSAIYNGTLSLTRAASTDKTALFIVTDGRNDVAEGEDEIAQVVFALTQADAEVFIFTPDVAKCTEEGNPLSLITSAVESKREAGGCVATGDVEQVISGLSDRAAKINLRYRPVRGLDGEQHNVTVRVVKRPFMGSGSTLIVYPSA
jgi:hypothetical protein